MLPCPVAASVMAPSSRTRALLCAGSARNSLGPRIAGPTAPGVVSERLQRFRLEFVAAKGDPLTTKDPISLSRLREVDWLVDPTGTDPLSEVGHLLAHTRVPDSRIRVFPSQSAADHAAALGPASHRPSSTSSPPAAIRNSQPSRYRARPSRCSGTPACLAGSGPLRRPRGCAAFSPLRMPCRPCIAVTVVCRLPSSSPRCTSRSGTSWAAYSPGRTESGARSTAGWTTLSYPAANFTFTTTFQPIEASL